MGSTLKTEIKRAVAAAYSGIWVNSYEQEDALREIVAACVEHCWQLLTWDPVHGCRDSNGKSVGEDANPGSAMSSLLSLDASDRRALLVMRNITNYLSEPNTGRVGEPKLLQMLQDTIDKGMGGGHFVVILTYDNVVIPPEVEKMMYVIDHPLPAEDERYELFGSVLDDADVPPRGSADARQLLDATAGLGRIETSGAIAMAMAGAKGAPKLDTIWSLKGRMLKKAGLLDMLSRGDGGNGFQSLGGLNVLKAFCKNMFTSANRSPQVRPLGVLLLGPAGAGKSVFSEALGAEIGWPTVRLDVGRLMGGLVGATEANTRRALASIDAMDKVIVMIDEVEKALAGTSGGEHDSGVGARLLGSLLTWMNDRTSNAFLVVTSNDISKLPPEFSRAERFDGIFFLDLPEWEQRKIIWDIYRKFYAGLGLSPAQAAETPPDDNWTPAEIKACCRLAVLHGVSLKDAASFIVPVYKTQKERIDNLRSWATGRCLSADYSGIYDQQGDHTMATPEAAAGALGTRRVRRVTRGE